MTWLTRIAAVVLATTWVGVIACGGGAKQPWQVKSTEREQYQQARTACKQLTDEPEGFDVCMNRRGFYRKGGVRTGLSKIVFPF